MIIQSESYSQHTSTQVPHAAMAACDHVCSPSSMNCPARGVLLASETASLSPCGQSGHLQEKADFQTISW